MKDFNGRFSKPDLGHIQATLKALQCVIDLLFLKMTHVIFMPSLSCTSTSQEMELVFHLTQVMVNDFTTYSP